MKEIKQEIIVRGTPRIENMPKEDFNVLCTSLLCLVEDYYKDYEYKKQGKRADKKIKATYKQIAFIPPLNLHCGTDHRLKIPSAKC